MRNHTIAIQGSSASFHDLAAKKYFGKEISPIECGSFREVCEKIAGNKADYGVIAIENKIAGSILLNYLLIDTYNLKIIGETYLPVELHLYGKKGTLPAGIKEIISHPMALGQCQHFLSGMENVLVSEYKDTSTCAKLVSYDPSGNTAVIAGPAVGKKYGLEMIRENVCDVKQNYTRFYILSKGQDYAEDANKASVSLQTQNQPGTLCDVLLLLRHHNLNLTKIQSVPLPSTNESYSFHLDIEFENKKSLVDALGEMKHEVKNCKILGIYKSGEKINTAKKIPQGSSKDTTEKHPIIYEN